MMRVMKEQMVSANSLPMLADAPNEFVRVPFVNDHKTGAFQRHVQIEQVQFVTDRLQLRIHRVEFANRFLPVLRHQIFVAPRIGRLVDHNVVPARNQFRRDAAKEMGVPVVPIRNEGVVEHHDFHAITSAGS